MAATYRVSSVFSLGFLIGACVNPVGADPGDVFPRPTTFFSFTGSGANSVADLATDADGNLYIAGTTTSPDLPVTSAVQASLGEAQIMRSTDRGVTWSKAANTPSASPDVIAVDPSNSAVLFIGAQEGLFKSTDGGQSWRKVVQTPTTAIVIDPRTPARMLAGGSAGILASTDRGENWALSLPGYGVTRFALDPLMPGRVLALPGSSALPVSDDMGSTWSFLGFPPDPGRPDRAAFDPFRPGWIYVVTGAGAL